MRTMFYVGAAGCEADIKSLDERLAFPGSRVFQMKGENHQVWKWRTESQDSKTPFVDDEVANFLGQNWGRLLLLAEYPRLHNVTVQIVSRRESERDRPHGYSFSKEVIKLLSALGADLDVDVTWYDAGELGTPDRD